MQLRVYCLILLWSLVSSIADANTRFLNLQLPEKYMPLVEIAQSIHKDHFSLQFCNAEIPKSYNKLAGIKLRRAEIEALSEQQALAMVRTSFDTRLKVKEALSNLVATMGADSTEVQECVTNVRSLNRVARMVEDYLGEWALWQRVKIDLTNPLTPIQKNYYSAYQFRKYGLLDPGLNKEGVKVKPFADGFPFTMTVNGKDKVKLKSGDILVTRGGTSISATIARIGDANLNFSHIMLVYFDQEPGKRCSQGCTIEAHIETGNRWYTLSEAVLNADNLLRVMVFRAKDSEVQKRAHQAAKHMFDLIDEGMSNDQVIPYDFAMDMEDHEKLFCSEVAQVGYQSVGVSLPTFPSKFERANTRFMTELGIKVKQTFAPADMEVEPQFDLIAEWRDYTRIAQAVKHDAILDVIFAKMEQEQNPFYFHRTSKSDAAAAIAMCFRKHSILGCLSKTMGSKDLVEEAFGISITSLFQVGKNLVARYMPEYMDERAISLTLQIESLFSPIQEKINRFERQKLSTPYEVSADSMQTHGAPLSFAEMKEVVSLVIEDELRQYKAGCKSDFAHFFRPENVEVVPVSLTQQFDVCQANYLKSYPGEKYYRNL